MTRQAFYDFSAFEVYKNKKPLMVCDNAYDLLGIDFPRECVRFSGFTSNPLYEDVPIMAVPTTSGTGSEATHFPVIYKDGRKQSIADERLLPAFVVLQPDAHKTLPAYQKKCAMLDAHCQAIESWRSKKATPESVPISDLELITSSVNLQRLQYHPIRLGKDTINALYKEILEVEEHGGQG